MVLLNNFSCNLHHMIIVDIVASRKVWLKTFLDSKVLPYRVEELEYALTVKDIDDEENEQTDMVNYQKTIEELQEQVQRERQRYVSNSKS